MWVSQARWALAAAVVFLPRVATADTLLSLSGTLSDGGTASGSLSVSSSGGVNPFPVKIVDKGVTYIFQGSFIQLPYTSLGGGQYVVSYDPVDELLLAFPQTSLVGYQGGSLCSLSTPCTNNLAASFFTPYLGGTGTAISFTSLTASAVPEPGTIALLGTGLLGMAEAVRRRVCRNGQSAILR